MQKAKMGCPPNADGYSIFDTKVVVRQENYLESRIKDLLPKDSPETGIDESSPKNSAQSPNKL